MNDRIVLHAPQKWGKTSWAAHFPDPFFVCSPGEDGIATLARYKRVPAKIQYKVCRTYGHMITALLDPKCKTLVLDTINGFERLLHEQVCKDSFGGKWKNFYDFDRGPKAAAAEFVELLYERLEPLRKKCTIILLAHSDVRNRKNPEAEDYGMWSPALHPKYGVDPLARWSDATLFGEFMTVVDSKGKAKGGTERVLRCEGEAHFEAGNRMGLPPEIECGDTALESYQNFKECF